MSDFDQNTDWMTNDEATQKRSLVDRAAASVYVDDFISPDEFASGNTAGGINTAIAYAASIGSNGINIFFNAGTIYPIRSAINLTPLNFALIGGQSEIIIEGNGCIVSCPEGIFPTGPMFDGLGCSLVKMRNMSIVSDAPDATAPTCGLQFGPINTSHLDTVDMMLDTVWVFGNFSLAAFYIGSPKFCLIDSESFFENDYSTAPAYVVIVDNANHFDIMSSFVTNTCVVDTPNGGEDISFRDSEINNPSVAANIGCAVVGSPAGFVFERGVNQGVGIPWEFISLPGLGFTDVVLDYITFGAHATEVLFDGPTYPFGGTVNGFKYHVVEATATTSIFAIGAPVLGFDFFNAVIEVNLGAANLLDNTANYNIVGEITMPANAQINITPAKMFGRTFDNSGVVTDYNVVYAPGTPFVITSASAQALAVGLNGATNPSFVVDDSTPLQVAGLSVKGAVTSGTVALAVLDSGPAANLSINAKGVGTIAIGNVSTGALTLGVATHHTGAVDITSASPSSLAVGLNGATNPAFTVDSSTGSQVAGLKVTGAVTGGTVALVTTDSGGANNLTINAKGTGTIGIGSVSTGAVTITPPTTVTGILTPTGGVAAAAGFTYSPRTCHTGNNAAANTTDFTDQTPVNTEFYLSEIFIPANATITGVAYMLGSVASGNIKVGLFDSTGHLVATSASTNAAGFATTQYNRVAFTGTYAAKGPATYYVGTFADNGTTRLKAHSVGNFSAQKVTGQVYATGFVDFAPSGTFVTALGPVATLY